ncbi:MAG: sulfurtransferase [Burkholderiales bacterium PBB5]|nr:MAG: sulfurtransferase [Burkholderiales bacterium PBB5]
MTANILNIAAYRFVPLDDLPVLQSRLQQAAEARQLKGTVLLAPEGINLFLAGADTAVNGWLAALQEDTRFAGITVKRSWSASQPFKRLKVKLKREIVRMDLPTLRPATARPPGVAPTTLARWLQQGHDDEGHPVKMLDTRNGFEVDDGAFEGAIDWRLSKFTEFPAALAARRDELAGATIVSYCTGGIRCEKAALVMQDLGIARCFQLDGGILQYFEDTGGTAPGWRGRCFVFDERVGLDPALHSAMG